MPLGTDGRRAPAAVGAGRQRAGLVPQAQVVGDAADRDAEQGGDLGDRAHAAVHGVDDAVAQFDRVGLHSRPQQRDKLRQKLLS